MTHILNAIVLLKLIKFHLVLSSEFCELGCEESDLDLYLEECRNACNVETDSETKNKMQEYLNCMHKSCLREGRGPDADLYLDESWLECGQQCDREEMLTSHEATEKTILHTQYLSDKQYENFKIITKMESIAKMRSKKKRKDKKIV